MGNTLQSLNKQLYLSDNKQHLLLVISPLAESITAAELTEIIGQSKYAALKIDPAGVEQAISAFAQLASDPASQSNVQKFVVAERLDAQLTLSIDPTSLIARAKIISAYGGQPLTLDQMTEKIKALNIRYGISKKILHLLIQKSKKSLPGTLYQAIIAKGTAPIDGYDARFERLVEIPSERVMKPQKTENGHVDMRELGKLVTVSQHIPLMRKIPYFEGTPGTTVTGESIDHIKGEDLPFDIGTNTEIDPNDNNILIASLAGIPHKIHNGMRVEDALIIENVDVGFGNVVYEGDVIIAGDICDGMKIKASGNITVAGFIESAQIECGGDLVVGKGILGRKITNTDTPSSCNINCKGSVTATFSQYTQMHIGKDLRIKNQLLHCSIFCLGHINVQNDLTNKGVILGGKLSAYKGISTVTLGAPSGTKTLIDLVGVYPELLKTQRKIKLAIQTEQDKLHSVFETQQVIASAPPTEKRKAIEMRLIAIKHQAEKTLLSLGSQQEDNLIAIQEYINNSKVTVFSKLHSHISISIGCDVFQSQESYGPTCISIEENKLVTHSI